MATLLEAHRDTTFHYWPAPYLYGVVNSHDEAETVLAHLLQVGVPADHLRTWYGEASDDPIDASGQHHGRVARLWRVLESITGERALLELYAQEVSNGHVCIGVRCGTTRAKTTVVSILREHGGYLLSYLSPGSVERLP
jgi:hypothetical protein